MKNLANFERLADAMYQRPPGQSRDELQESLPSFPIEDDSEGDTRASVRMPRMYDSPITPLHVLSDSDPPPKPRAGSSSAPSPTPSPKRVAAEPKRAGILAAFMVLRGGATASRGLARSSLAFLVLLAFAVLAVVIAGLAIMAPSSDWALSRG